MFTKSNICFFRTNIYNSTKPILDEINSFLPVNIHCNIFWKKHNKIFYDFEFHTFAIEDPTNERYNQKLGSGYIVYRNMANNVYRVLLVHNTARIGNNFKWANHSIIMENVNIGDNVEIGHNCVIGKDCILENNIKIEDRVFLGERVHVGSNTIICENNIFLNDVIIGTQDIIKYDSKNNLLPLEDTVNFRRIQIDGCMRTF